MFTARPQKNLVHAKQYFREHLAHGDYYSQNQKVAGVWFGKGAARLGLEPGQLVAEAAFVRLCDNLHPATGQKLTVRQRQKNRRVFFDFAVAPPKSVSIMGLVVGDERILAAHAASSLAAVAQLEKLAATRIRRGGQVRDRVTGEIIAAAFQHDASRSLDPHLHTHFVVFNATWDDTEQRWKALETRRMFDAMNFLTEVYRNEMTHRLQAMGYQLRQTAHGFEIQGVSDEIIQRFSKRRQAILAESTHLEDELKQVVSNNSRAAIAHHLRERKLRDLGSTELRALQRAQLSANELAALELLKTGPPAPQAKLVTTARAVERVRLPGLKNPAPGESVITSAAVAAVECNEAVRLAIDFARDHVFERRSVVQRTDLLAVALKHGRGLVSLAQLETELASRTELVIRDDLLATKTGLAEERRILELVNQGVEQCRPLRASHRSRKQLSDEQNTALTTLLESPDRMMSLRGAAGTGKTEVLHEFVEAVHGRHELLLLAPTKSAVKALSETGLDSAQTVQWFLTNPAAHEKLRQPVVVVDEAGLLSNRQMLAIIEWVHQRQGRLVLAGDTRQHAGVEAGDALRLLEQRSAIRKVPLREIQRHKNAEYRAAISDLAEGHGARAVERLEKLGAIEVHEADVQCSARAAEEYVASVSAGKSALVVCPTWREVDATNAEIRARLQAVGKVSRTERTVTGHRSLKWTQAQKRDFAGYAPGLVLNFHTTTQVFNAGESTEVLAVHPDRLTVRHGRSGKASITRKQLACFEVAKAVPLPVAKDDRLLIQGNHKAAHLVNGQVVTVESVARDGSIRLDNGHTIPPDFRLFTHAHAVTSQTAQGRTVDHVYVVMNQFSEAANEKALYVSASRGRERVKLFCDSEDTPWRAIERPGTRLSATEMLEAARQRETENVNPRVRAKVKV
jgi:conjugative relaxase-like TrwC/TraI family protein